MTDRAETTCPACAEPILAAAKKCRHCGSVVAEARALYSPKAPQPKAADEPVVVAQPWARTNRPKAIARPLEVSFSEALPLAMSNYDDFDGRATRGEYWWFVLNSFLINILASWIGVFLFGVGSDAQIALYWIVVLVMAVPGFSVFVRRLHDTGHSGWSWLLCLTIIGAIPVFIWLIDEGDVRPNAYGPPRTM